MNRARSRGDTVSMEVAGESAAPALQLRPMLSPGVQHLPTSHQPRGACTSSCHLTGEESCGSGPCLPARKAGHSTGLSSQMRTAHSHDGPAPRLAAAHPALPVCLVTTPAPRSPNTAAASGPLHTLIPEPGLSISVAHSPSPRPRITAGDPPRSHLKWQLPQIAPPPAVSSHHKDRHPFSSRSWHGLVQPM